MTNTEMEQNIAEIWALYRENREQLVLLREQSKATDYRFQEADRRFQETERLLKEKSLETDRQMKETDRQMKETDRQMRETDKRINKVYGTFSNQWGRLIEALVEPDSTRLFQERGVKITGSSSRVKRAKAGDTLEVDVLLTNSTELVLLEVKTTANQEAVDDLLYDLGRFDKFFSEYQHYKLYGALAGLEIPDQVRRKAYKQGLFVVSLTGQGLLKIDNDANFTPKNFGAETTA